MRNAPVYIDNKNHSAPLLLPGGEDLPKAETGWSEGEGGWNNTFSTQLINAAFGEPCGASWAMGVWMYDVKANECLFYSPKYSGAPFRESEGVSREGAIKENARCGNNGPFKTKNKKHVVKLTKNIIIDMVTTTPTHVLVDWHTPAMQANQSLQVNRFAFEQWLYETCRLDWCLHDITSHQRAFDTTMSVDNYWLYGDYGVQYGDVVTYIIEHGLATLNCG